jgi:hypothetical protein
MLGPMDSGRIHLEAHLGEIEKTAICKHWSKPGTTKLLRRNCWG